MAMLRRPLATLKRLPTLKQLALARLCILVLLWLALPFALTGCSADAVKQTLQSMQKEAPELSGATGWVNTGSPVTLKDLRGKIVLLDFSTYSCVNCIHIMPFIKSVERKYGDAVQVITVHSGKYANEKTDSYIQYGIDRYGVGHPVANDANATIWEAYGAKAWPTLVLINPVGKIVGETSGDSKVALLDKTIRMLVAESESDKTLKRAAGVPTISTKKETVLSFPAKVVVDGDRLLVSDTGHNRLLLTDLNGKILRAIGSGKAEDADGDFAHAAFNEPGGFCKVGNEVYVADTGNGAIKVVDLAKGNVSTLARGSKDGVLVSSRDGTGCGAGSNVNGVTAFGGAGSVVPFDRPTDVAVDGKRLFVSMNGTHQIWELGLADKKARAVAGSGTEGLQDGAGDKAELAQPEGLSIGGDSLYFVDSESSAVRRFGLNDGKVSTLVGKGLFEFGDKDGANKEALLQHPLGICYDRGTIYVSDSFNHKIKTVNQTTGQCATLCGCGNAGYTDGEFPQMCSPTGLSLAGDKLYVADANNHRIRVFKLADGTMSTLNIKQ